MEEIREEQESPIVEDVGEIGEPKAKKQKKKFKFKLPTTFTILLGITLVIILLSWIPGLTKITEKDGVKSGGPAGILDLFLAPMKGFGDKVEVIVFILILGGFLGLIIDSKALDAGIGRLVKKMKGHEVWIIPIIMILFSIGGTVYGMGEETIALYPVIIPIFVAAGFDVMTAVLTILLGAGTGVCASILNPFVIQLAVDASGTDITASTGIVWRVVSWAIFTAMSTGFVVWYALRVKKRPEKSVLFAQKEELEKEFSISQDVPEYTKKHKAIIAIFIITFIIMIISLVSWSTFGVKAFEKLSEALNDKFPFIVRFFGALGAWGFLEVSALFLVSAIIIGFIDWNGEENLVNGFIRGSADIMSVCLVIAFAAGIGFIMTDTGMKDVFVEGMSNAMKGLKPALFIIISFIFFLLISIVLPSSSGFAGAVFPILGPVAQGVGGGLTAGSITSFSFANGIINLMSPTSAILMAALAVSKVSYGKFLKASWPIIIGLIVGSIILLGVGSTLPVGPKSPWF